MLFSGAAFVFFFFFIKAIDSLEIERTLLYFIINGMNYHNFIFIRDSVLLNYFFIIKSETFSFTERHILWFCIAFHINLIRAAK